MRGTLLPAIILVALLMAGTSSVLARDICIRCTGPEQTYRCAVLGDAAPADLRRQSFYCAARIAEDEDHSTCAAVRKETQCRGVRRSYVYDASAPTLGPLAQDEPSAGEDEADNVNKEEGPPRTVVDLTRETARRTEEGLERAADETVETTRGLGQRVQDAAENAAGAVDRAARSTIRCIGSLFDDC